MHFAVATQNNDLHAVQCHSSLEVTDRLFWYQSKAHMRLPFSE